MISLICISHINCLNQWPGRSGLLAVSNINILTLFFAAGQIEALSDKLAFSGPFSATLYG